jgi:L-amino acid N-acyltransferase YncA
MNDEFEIVSINKENLHQHPGAICFINPKNPVHPLKINWINQRFSEGLQIKLIYSDNKKKVIGFIEYLPGEYAWRAVSAKSYMFIHCLWIYPNQNKNKGLGTRLINECISDAKQNNYNGVAVVSSQGAFMANRNIFLKTGFREVDGNHGVNELLSINFKDGPAPYVKDWQSQLLKYQGLHIIYTKQCPWVARMVHEIMDSDLAKRLELKITELKTATEAQNAPSLYASFNLIYNGKLLADRYISITRFNNILKKEKLI